MAEITIFLVLLMGCLVQAQVSTSQKPFYDYMLSEPPYSGGILHVECKPEKPLACPDVQYNFKTVCGEGSYAYVVLNGIASEQLPLTARAWVGNSDCEIEIPYEGGDITDILTTDCQILTACSDFDGSSVEIGVSVVDSFKNDLVIHRTQVKVLPDFANVDLGWFEDQPPFTQDVLISIDDTNPTLKAAVSASTLSVALEDLAVDMDGAQPIHIPAEPHGFYAVLYWAAGGDDALATKSNLIGAPVKWRTPGELTEAWVKLRDRLMWDEETRLYEEGFLTFDFDMFGSAWNEPNKDNNNLTIKYYSTLTRPIMEADACVTIKNPWTTDQAGFTHQSSYNRDLFLYQNMTWYNELPWQENLGYFYLDALQKYVNESEELRYCTGLGEDDLIDYIKSVEQADSSLDIFVDYYVDYALSSATELSSGYNDVNDIIASLLVELEPYQQMSVVDIQQVAAFVALNETLNIANEKLSGAVEIYVENAYTRLAFDLVHTLYANGHSKDLSVFESLAATTARLLVISTYRNMPTAGYRQLLNVTATQAYGGRNIWELLFYGDGCPLWQAYIKRLSLTAYGLMGYHTDTNSIMESQDVICEAVTSRKLAKDIWKTLGLHEVRQYLEEKDYTECGRDVLEPSIGLTDVFEWRANSKGIQELYQGTVLLDRGLVGWTKIAVCSCSQCNDGRTTNVPFYGTGPTQGWKPGSTDSSWYNKR